jgi:hypothetical protein
VPEISGKAHDTLLDDTSKALSNRLTRLLKEAIKTYNTDNYNSYTKSLTTTEKSL